MAQRKRKEPSKVSLAELGNEPAPIEVETKAPKQKPIEESVPILREIASKDIPDTFTFQSESFLSKKEREFYVQRRAEYYGEFNLNKSSDIGLIHRVIMEEILAERLYSAMLKDPQLNLSNELDASSTRYQKALESLGASRDKRIKNRETAGVSIADLASEWAEEKKDRYEIEKQKKLMEEELLVAEQDHRLELEFGTVKDKEDREISWEELV